MKDLAEKKQQGDEREGWREGWRRADEDECVWIDDEMGCCVSHNPNTKCFMAVDAHYTTVCYIYTFV